MSRILLIDLSAVFYPRYKMTGGEDVATASRGALSQIHDLASRYEHCAIACDSLKSFRRELSKDYKANRERDPVAKELLFKLQETLRGDGFVLWQAEGFEADDVLATASLTAWVAGHDSVIATSDKDLLACVRSSEGQPSISVFHTMKLETFDEEKVRDRFGLRPEQIPDYLALVGDASDNVPGVRGCGPKHASRLLQEFGTLDELIARARSASIAPASVQTNLLAAVADGSLALSRKLIALRRDVPGINIQDALAPRVPKPQPEGVDYMADDSPHDEAPPAEPTPAQNELAFLGEQIAKRDAAAAAAANAAPPAPKESTALAVIEAELIAPSDPRFIAQIEPRSLNEAWRFAKGAFGSRLFAVNNPEAAWAIIVAGRSLGLGAVAALQGAHIIKGRVCWHASIIIGRVMASGLADYIEVSESSATSCTWIAKRKGRPEKKLTWTMENAKRAGLLGKADSNWDKYPDVMLMWRCGTAIARMVFFDVTANIYTPEEMGDEREPAPAPPQPLFTTGGASGQGAVSAHPDDTDFLGNALDDPKPLDGETIRRIERYAETLDLSRADLVAILTATCGSGDLAKCPATKEPEILAAIKAKGEEK